MKTITMHWMKSFGPWLLVAAISTMTTTAAAGNAVIAVAAEGADADATVSAVAARAPYLLLFDAQGTLVASHPNPVEANPGGTGPALAAWLTERNITTLIAGEFGAKLVPALEANNIGRVTANGPAGAAAKKAAQ